MESGSTGPPGGGNPHGRAWGAGAPWWVVPTQVSGVSFIQIMQIRVQNKRKSVRKSRYVGDVLGVTGEGKANKNRPGVGRERVAW